MKNSFLLLLSLLWPFLIFSQNDPIKWKSLSKDDIEFTSFESEPDAPAVVLCDYEQMYFDLNPNGENLFLFREKHIRIKILKEEGLKYAKFRIPYHDMNCEKFEKELSYNIKAVTHSISDKGAITTTRLKNKYIKHRDSTDCIRIAEVEFPDAKVGSIIELKYIIPSFDMIWPESRIIEWPIPVLVSEFRARIPQNFKYIFSLQNGDSFENIDSVYYNKSIILYNKYGYRTTQLINLQGTEYQYRDYNVPSQPVKRYSKMLNMHLSFLKAQPMEYGYERLTRALMITLDDTYEQRTPSQRKMLPYPAGYIQYNKKNWDDVTESLLNDRKFSLALVKYWETDSILKNCINDNQSSAEKAKAVYNLVKDHMKWNKEFSIYVDIEDHEIVRLINKTGANLKQKNLGDIWETGTGNSSEINFILMRLLSKAGFKVTPVLSNTSDNYQLDKNIPEVKQFKTVLAMVEIDGNKILLDAADPNSKFDQLAEKYKDAEKFAVDRLEYGWIDEAN